MKKHLTFSLMSNSFSSFSFDAAVSSANLASDSLTAKKLLLKIGRPKKF